MKKLVLLSTLLLVIAVVFCGCGKDAKPYDYDLGEYITLGDFPGVKYDADKVDEAYEEEAESIASEFKTTESVTDRAVEDGDTVKIDYVGKIDGKEFEGGSANGTELEIGSDSFIAGFEDGLIGKKLNEEVTLNLVFPEDYKNADVAGKDVVFTVKINAITANIIPELTDSMVQEKTEYDNVTDFADAIREQAARDQLWETYLESCKVVKYPKEETKKYYDRLLDSYSQVAVYNGMTLEAMVTSYYGYKTLDEFLSYAMSLAMSSVKEEMVLYSTARNNNIEISDADYQKIGTELAKEAGYETLEDYEGYMAEDGIRLEIYRKLVVDKAFEANNIKFEKIIGAEETLPADTPMEENNAEPSETNAG